tara:strand:- start:404 stop:862 length:459 start_codon:yes stop_codon:yes gene_type:complete
MDLIDGISDIENFGIDLKLSSSEAEDFYCEALRIWFSTERGYSCYTTTNKEFVVGSGDTDLATIYIYDSVLRMKSMAEEPYEILMCILEFIAENHKKVVSTYEYLVDNESKWYVPELKEKKYKSSDVKLKKATKQYPDSEESTEEDSDDEWI